jgi:hypothetical protein
MTAKLSTFGMSVESQNCAAREQPLLGNDCATHFNGVTVGSAVSYMVCADSYIRQQQKNCWERCFLWGPC